MPHLDHTGPEGKGPKTGRKLGKCKKTSEELLLAGQLGKGMGKKYHSNECKQDGKGKRNQHELPKNT